MQFEQDQVDVILKHVSDIYKGTNSLVILDDCGSSLGVRNCVSEIVRLAFSPRHYSLSTIVKTQQLTSISKPYRENISELITFYNPNRNDMKTITDDYLYGVSNDEIKDTVEKLKNNEYARLEINLRHPYDCKIVVPQA